MMNDEGYPVPLDISDTDYRILYRLWSNTNEDKSPPRDETRSKLRLNGSFRTMGRIRKHSTHDVRK